MDKRRLLSHIVSRTNSYSRCYKAEVQKSPRLYHSIVAGTLFPSLKRGIYFKKNLKETYLTRRAFVFETDILRYARHQSHIDKCFKKRLLSLELNSDDIENMIRALTFFKVKLFLKGRKGVSLD